MTELRQAELAKELGFWPATAKDGRGNGNGVAATNTESA
jgi:hypothetical protein